MNNEIIEFADGSTYDFPMPGFPPKVCFSCGNELPPSDFDDFHEKVKERERRGFDNLHAMKIVLDRELTKPYIRPCCRTMFMGDAKTYRDACKLYDYSGNVLEIDADDDV